MRSTFVALSVLAGQAFAGVFITNPTATTTANGGASFTINWQEDNKGPTLADVGPVEVGIFVGNVIQQTEVQQIDAAVDVSKQNSLTFNINNNIGPSGSDYFIRMTSLSLPSPDNAQFKYQSFSSKFQINGLNGQFSPEAAAQIAGASTAGTIGGAATAVLAGTSGITSIRTAPTTSAASTASTASTATPARNSTNTAAGAQQTGNGAIVTKGNIGVLGTVAVVLALAL